MAKRDDGARAADEVTSQRLGALDRIVQQAIGAEVSLGLATDDVATRYPEVWRWITQVYWGKDHVVTPAIITIRAGPEGIIAAITHRDLACQAEVCVPHVADVLGALEAAIGGPTPAVKQWGRRQPTLRKRKSAT